MPGDAFFRMTVKDVFFIKGRGTVVTGRIESGSLRVGDEVHIGVAGFGRRAVVTGIEMSRKQLQQAQGGDNVGVLLRDLSKQDVNRGDVLTGS